MPLHVSSACAHHQEFRIALHSLCYHHTYRWPSRAQVETATFRCDDTRGCVMQFWPPDDKHMCSKHVQAWNKLIVKQKFCVSSWLITEINILRCTVSKTSKFIHTVILWHVFALQGISLGTTDTFCEQGQQNACLNVNIWMSRHIYM